MSNPSFAQTDSITFSYSTNYLDNIFQDIENQTYYTFVYDPRILPLSRRYSVPAQRGSLTKILDELLKPSNIKWQFINNQIVLKRIGVQRHSIHGLAYLHDSDRPAPNALVTTNTGRFTRTDHNGNFVLQLMEGTHILKVENGTTQSDPLVVELYENMKTDLRIKGTNAQEKETNFQISSYSTMDQPSDVPKDRFRNSTILTGNASWSYPLATHSLSPFSVSGEALSGSNHLIAGLHESALAIDQKAGPLFQYKFGIKEQWQNPSFLKGVNSDALAISKTNKRANFLVKYSESDRDEITFLGTYQNGDRSHSVRDFGIFMDNQMSSIRTEVGLEQLRMNILWKHHVSPSQNWSLGANHQSHDHNAEEHFMGLDLRLRSNRTQVRSSHTDFTTSYQVHLPNNNTVEVGSELSLVRFPRVTSKQRFDRTTLDADNQADTEQLVRLYLKDLWHINHQLTAHAEAGIITIANQGKRHWGHQFLGSIDWYYSAKLQLNINLVSQSTLMDIVPLMTTSGIESFTPVFIGDVQTLPRTTSVTVRANYQWMPAISFHAKAGLRRSTRYPNIFALSTLNLRPYFNEVSEKGIRSELLLNLRARARTGFWRGEMRYNYTNPLMRLESRTEDQDFYPPQIFTHEISLEIGMDIPNQRNHFQSVSMRWNLQAGSRITVPSLRKFENETVVLSDNGTPGHRLGSNHYLDLLYQREVTVPNYERQVLIYAGVQNIYSGHRYIRGYSRFVSTLDAFEVLEYDELPHLLPTAGFLLKF